jgi:hypothetical protein
MAVSRALAMYRADRKPARGIIPLDPIEIDPRDVLIYDIATMISEALAGPAIGVHELAEMIVDTVQEGQ